MSRYKSEQTAYNPLKKKYVPLWSLDTNTVTVTHFNADTLTEESKTYSSDFIRYHLHFSDSHCSDRSDLGHNVHRCWNGRNGDALCRGLLFFQNHIKKVTLQFYLKCKVTLILYSSGGR